ncbi:hypothetical protein DRO31_02745 [Candidatus Bathyarchaeota archaeon]|nr:MAG: hypothetical protein DRO31_02745 [Candidatus Bathyarchaeota archaeon]HHL41801.1 hypothetical protein [Candidatus Bathyarchaeota archaeon]
MEYSEGDYIQTTDGLFFAVKGGRHDADLVVAVLRYIPDITGDRVLDGVNYRRIYDLNDSTKYLLSSYPSYISKIPWLGLETQSVPTSKITKVYNPKEKLEEILENPNTVLKKRIKNFVEALSSTSGVNTSCYGLSGSLLIGLDNEASDIDLNVYGEIEGRKVYAGLKKLRQNMEWITGYDSLSVEDVLVSRWGKTGLDLEKLRTIECRKILHGRVFGVDYFIRLLREKDKSTSIPLKSVTIRAKVTDSSESIYTPCTYRVQSMSNEYPVVELKSYRGKFTEQVEKNDIVEVNGILEKVTRDAEVFFRIILGRAEDYLVSVDLIG